MISKRLPAAFAFGMAVSLAACEAQGTPAVTAMRSSPSFQNTVNGASEQSVAYQVDTEHTGFAQGPLRRPLTRLWSVRITGRLGIGYPVVANGIVVVTANDKLIALNDRTGQIIWAKNSPRGYGWIGPAYDDGRIFASPVEAYGPKNLGMYAFDERTGEKLWSAPSPYQYAFSSPPTAAAGMVYTAAAGSGGTLYAYDESSGALRWSASVDYGDDSSPVVTPDGLFVSYACPQTYDFNPISGKKIWQYSGPCAGGGGSTPVLYNGLLFVEDSEVSVGYDGLILRAKNGDFVGSFNADVTPAFAHNLGFFINGKTLEARSIPKMKRVWSIEQSFYDAYVSPPLVVGDIVYATTLKNELVGYDVYSGKQRVLIKLSKHGFYRHAGSGLAYGDGELIVPNGLYLVAFKGS